MNCFHELSGWMNGHWQIVAYLLLIGHLPLAIERCATSCTNGTCWPFCQPNYVVVSTQPAHADVFCSHSTRTSHILDSPPGFGRAPHPPEWPHMDKLWHLVFCRQWRYSPAALPPACRTGFSAQRAPPTARASPRVASAGLHIQPGCLSTG